MAPTAYRSSQKEHLFPTKLPAGERGKHSPLNPCHRTSLPHPGQTGKEPSQARHNRFKPRGADGNASANGVDEMNIETRPATLGDVDTLAAWNKQLIEDEGSRNPMNLQQLRDRMTGLLNGEWRAVILSVDGEETGYMLYKEGRDDYSPNQPTVYIRQFFIHRSKRSRGIGETAFNLIAKKHFPKGSELSLEVLESNPRGRGFWEKIGFQTYCTTLKRKDTQFNLPPSPPYSRFDRP